MIRIFIGTEPAQKLACEVLKHSIRSRTRHEVEFTEIGSTRLSLPMQTGFSFARWAVPKLAGYNGFAIYLDADIVALGNIEKLWDLPLDKSAVRARPSEQGRFFTSVMLLGCGSLKHWNFDELLVWMQKNPRWYGAFMWATPGTPYARDFSPLPRCWNDLDNVKEDTCLLHYTDLKRQPWRYAGHPFGKIWQDALKAAMQCGAVTPQLVAEEIALGHVRSEVLTIP